LILHGILLVVSGCLSETFMISWSLINSNPRDSELGLLFFREGKGNPKHYEIKRAENESNKLYVKRMVETSAQTSFSPRMG